MTDKDLILEVARTLRSGLNFTPVTDAGELDLLGEVTGLFGGRWGMAETGSLDAALAAAPAASS